MGFRITTAGSPGTQDTFQAIVIVNSDVQLVDPVNTLFQNFGQVYTNIGINAANWSVTLLYFARFSNPAPNLWSYSFSITFGRSGAITSTIFRGVTGVPGLPGLPGPTGSVGPTGAFGGPPGPTGWTGPVGPQGETGIKGDTGATGPQGKQGSPGVTGPFGGPQGDQGSPGVTGATGPQGSQGIRGVTGATGPTGPQGLQGVTGALGPTGVMGPTGSQGLQGSPGVTGQQGPQGVTGFGASSQAFGVLFNKIEDNVRIISNIQDQFYKLKWTEIAASQINSPSTTDSDILINLGGAYQILLNATVYSSSGQEPTAVIAIFVNGVIAPDAQCQQIFLPSDLGEVISVSTTKLLNVGDVVDVRIKLLSGGPNQAINIPYGSLSVISAGGSSGVLGPQGSPGPTGPTGPAGSGGFDIGGASAPNSVLQIPYPATMSGTVPDPFWAPLTQDQILPAWAVTFGTPTSTVELGAIVATPPFTASYNRPAAITPGSEILTDTEGTPAKDVSATPASFTSNGIFQATGIGDSVTFHLAAHDENGLAKTVSTAITWKPHNYYGTGDPGQTGGAFILALQNSFYSTARQADFNVTAATGKTIYYAHPQSEGLASFKIGGFSVTMIVTLTNLTNSYNMTTPYYLYESETSGLGATEVVVL